MSVTKELRATSNGSHFQQNRVTMVSAAYNESSNLVALYERLHAVMSTLSLDWEWVVVDDHSQDATFEALQDLSQRDARVRGIRLTRNCGSHLALTCGLRSARGGCAIVLAADLQDPPEKIPELLEAWQRGAQIVWAVRERREGESLSTRIFSRLYFFLMRHLVGLREMPPTGADFFLLDGAVLRALRRFDESHVSLFALITWMGFRQQSISYTKAARLHGITGWTLEKKVKIIVDSVTAFSYLPIRFMGFLGTAIAILGLAYASLTFVRALRGIPLQGWASLMIVTLVMGGLQMVMLGVLGEYLWRTLDEARRRPRFLIEAITQGSIRGHPGGGSP